jgi:hypothetical protein
VCSLLLRCVFRACDRCACEVVQVALSVPFAAAVEGELLPAAPTPREGRPGRGTTSGTTSGGECTTQRAVDWPLQRGDVVSSARHVGRLRLICM